MRVQILGVATILSISTALPARAQAPSPQVPPTAARLLAQVIWPRNLFDSLGQPEPGFQRRGFEPDFTDLRVSARTVTVAQLPGVSFYVASAYPHDCWHCATRIAAVASREGSYLALENANQLPDLLQWAHPAIAEADSNAIREFIIATASATCLLGCDSLRQVRSRGELTRLESQLLQPVGPECAKWAFPRTYTHTSPGQLTMEFVLYRPNEALYRVLVRQQQDGRSLTFSFQQVATLGMP